MVIILTVAALLALLFESNAIRLDFNSDNSDFEIYYTSQIKVHTRNPDYHYTARKSETQSLHIHKVENDPTKGSYYEFILQTRRFTSNVTEYQQEDRIHDSDTLNRDMKNNYPLFSNVVRYKIRSNGELVEPADVPNAADLNDESFQEIPGYPRISDTLPMELISSFYQAAIKHDSLLGDEKTNKKAVKKIKGNLALGHYHANELFNVLFKPKKQSTKQKAANEQSISVVNGRLDDSNNDTTIIDARLKGSLKMDVNSGIVKYFKINTGRDIEHPRIGLHWLYEEIVITVTDMKTIMEEIKQQREKDAKRGIETKAKSDTDGTEETEETDRGNKNEL